MQKDAPERNYCISFPQPWHIISTHHGIGFWVLRGIFSDSPEHLFKLSGASFCLRARVPYYIFIAQGDRNRRTGGQEPCEMGATKSPELQDSGLALENLFRYQKG